MKRALVLCLALAGCEQPRTELMIGVVTDIRAPNLIDGAELLVTRAQDGFIQQQVSWQISGLPNQPFNLPGTYGVYSDGDEIKLDIVLTGLKGATPMVTRRAVLNLVEGKTLFFRMGMTLGCSTKTDCLATESCVEGVCRNVEVNSLQLPDFDVTLPGTLTCNGGTGYIDTSTGAPLPMSADAASCPPELCFEGTCLKPPPGSGGSVSDEPSPVDPGNTSPDAGNGGSAPDAGTTGTAVSTVPCPTTPAASISTTDGLSGYTPTVVNITAGQIVRFQMSPMHDVVPLPPNTHPALDVPAGTTECLQFFGVGSFDFTNSPMTFTGTVQVAP
ncbi:MAG: hypothetical protein M4D80_35770 [Myxococcota bacterium]|nr:hypothetical protein [Deltaproteobacteria bacterium]MDQ3340548.1 hypothetical protein [Myxococcota bacterium]